MSAFWRLQALALIAVAATAACTPSEEYIDARIHLATSQPSQVTLGAGQDRHAYNEMAPGELREIRLVPGRSSTRADERRLHVEWRAQGQRHEWSGPDLPRDVSYRIDLRLQADGRVESEYCVVPCSLPVR